MVYVLIPAHNNKQEVLGILRCLDRQSYRGLQVILVDDGSTDGTPEGVKRGFPKTIVLRGTGNLWWTGANVLGVHYILSKACRNDYILLLNNDLEVGENYIERLVNHSEANGRAIVGSTLVDSENHEHMEAGLKIDKELNITVNRDLRDIERRDFDPDVDILPGRGTLVPIEVFQTVGTFNRRRLPHYGADYEFSVRAKRAGFPLIVSHRAKVYARLDITGFTVPNKRIVPLRECFRLLFSKKSKANLLYYSNYVWLCSDPDYRWKNLARSIYSTFSSTLFKSLPGHLFRWLVIRPLLFTGRFLFKSYPITRNDAVRYGLDVDKLFDYGLVELTYRFGDVDYLKLLPIGKLKGKLERLPDGDRINILQVHKKSKSYSHKARVFMRNLGIHLEELRRTKG